MNNINNINNFNTLTNKDKIASEKRSEDFLHNAFTENSNLMNFNNYNNFNNNITNLFEDSNLNILKNNYNSNLHFGDNLFNSNNLNSMFIRNNMEDSMMKKINNTNTMNTKLVYNTTNNNNNNNFNPIEEPLTQQKNIARKIEEVSDESTLLNKKTKNKKEKKPKDTSGVKSKIKNKRTKPVNLDEILNSEIEKNKTSKNQNINISSTNPCIINQNNFFNNYPNYQMNNKNMDIPEPSNFIADKQPVMKLPYYPVENYMMNYPSPRFPIYFYPPMMMNDYPTQQPQFLKNSYIKK